LHCAFHGFHEDSTFFTTLLQDGKSLRKLQPKELTLCELQRSSLPLCFIRLFSDYLTGLMQVCYLLETDTHATGKFFAERREIDWVDAAF
jgi:hypothetical protein